MTESERAECILRNLPVDRRHLRVVEDETEWALAEREGRVLGGCIVPRQSSTSRTFAESTDHALMAADADQAQVLDPSADQDEPTDPAERLRFWKAKAVWAETVYEFERAQAHVLALGGGDPSAWEQDTLNATLASMARGERIASEPPPSPLAATQAAARDEFAASLVSPFAQVVPVEVLMRDPRSGLTAWVPQKSLTRGQAVTVAEKLTGQINLRESGGLVPTRKVMVKEVLARDSNGDVLRVKEYTVDEPIPADGTPPVESTRLLGHPSPR